MSFPRPLTATEKAIAHDLLDGAGVRELETLAEQLEVARAVGGCECGCPTISIAVDGNHARPASYSGKPVATADYEGGSIMVWIEDGWLSHLEVYWWTDDVPTEFPAVNELRDHRPG